MLAGSHRYMNQLRGLEKMPVAGLIILAGKSEEESLSDQERRLKDGLESRERAVTLGLLLEKGPFLHPHFCRTVRVGDQVGLRLTIASPDNTL